MDSLVCVMLDFVFIIRLGWLFASVGYSRNHENWATTDSKKSIIRILNHKPMQDLKQCDKNSLNCTEN